MSDEKPLVYLILGAPGAGRREIVADLIEDGLEKADNAVVFLAADEATDPADDRLNTIQRWSRTDDGRIDATWPTDATVGFFIVSGRRNPVDQIEAFKPWLQAQGVELGRVICVYHSALVAAEDRLRTWYDACVHFSDIVLLNRRDGVENKWVSDLRTYFAKQYLPCLIETVKKGRVANPALVLDQQTRRMSHWFDEAEDGWAAQFAGDSEIVIEDEAEDDPDEAPTEEDVYLARHPSGRRVKEIPDIAAVLDAK